MRTIAAGLLSGLIAVGCGQTMPPGGASTDVALTSSSSAPDGSTPAAGTMSSTADSAKSASTATSGTSPGAWHDVTIPAGTTLALALDTAVASDTSRVEEPVHAHLTRAVAIDGVTVIPEESAVSGVVTSATRAGKVDGRAHLAIRFDTLAPLGQDERYQLQANAFGRTAPSEKKKDAAKIGVPAAGGAIIGGIVGGKKGAVIGGAVGGGAGTAVVLSDRGKEVRMAKGAAISLKLTEPLTIRVRGRG
jgi:hypothetical protein